MRFRTPPDHLPELMDAPDCDVGELAAALDALAHAGRVLGDDRLLRRRVARVVGNPGTTNGNVLRVLDVGAGGGDGSVALRNDLARAGWEPHFVLSDLHAQTLELCRGRVHKRLGADAHVRYVRLDGTRLPFAENAFDLAICTRTLHHLSDDEAASFISDLDRVARLGWVVTDLWRSPRTLLAVRLLAATIWRRHRFPRTDGPISVRRSFTPREIRSLLAKLEITSARVRAGVVRWEAWSG
ncbi:MAG: methyltransferase domain-containing protein [Gemmatimonadota bacterium]